MLQQLQARVRSYSLVGRYQTYSREAEQYRAEGHSSSFVFGCCRHRRRRRRLLLLLASYCSHTHTHVLTPEDEEESCSWCTMSATPLHGRRIVAVCVDTFTYVPIRFHQQQPFISNWLIVLRLLLLPLAVTPPSHAALLYFFFLRPLGPTAAAAAAAVLLVFFFFFFFLESRGITTTLFLLLLLFLSSKLQMLRTAHVMAHESGDGSSRNIYYYYPAMRWARIVPSFLLSFLCWSVNRIFSSFQLIDWYKRRHRHCNINTQLISLFIESCWWWWWCCGLLSRICRCNPFIVVALLRFFFYWSSIHSSSSQSLNQSIRQQYVYAIALD